MSRTSFGGDKGSLLSVPDYTSLAPADQLFALRLLAWTLFLGNAQRKTTNVVVPLVAR